MFSLQSMEQEKKPTELEIVHKFYEQPWPPNVNKKSENFCDNHRVPLNTASELQCFNSKIPGVYTFTCILNGKQTKSF